MDRGNSDSNIEDGEIVDSDDSSEMKKVDRTKLTLQMPRQAPLSAFSHRGSAPVLSSDEDSDSEVENFNSPCKKKPNLSWPSTHHSTFQNPNLDNGVLREPPKKGKNIWGAMLTEESLASEVKDITTGKKIDRTRDVESYDYTRAEMDHRRTLEPEDDMFDVDSEEDEEETQGLEDVETFGMAPVKKVDIRARLGCREVKDREKEDKRKERKVDVKERLGCKRPQGQRLSRKRTFKTRQMQSVEIKDRLGVRSFDPNKDRSHVQVTVEDSVQKVAEELMRILGEPVEQLQLFCGLVEAVGQERALEILYMTEDLEDSGGVMTLNGTRRRTPGGVFLMLVREVPVRDPQKVSEIFKEQSRLHYKNIKAQKKKSKRRNRSVEDDQQNEEGDMQIQEPDLPSIQDVVQPVIEPSEEALAL